MIDRMLQHLLVFLMASLIVTVAIQVGSRYLLRSPVGWADEVSRFLLIYITFIGSYVALRMGAHIQTTSLANLFPAKLLKTVDFFMSVLIGLVGLVLLVNGTEYVSRFMGQTSPYLHMPMGAIYGIIPVAGVLYVLFAVVRIRVILRNGQ